MQGTEYKTHPYTPLNRGEITAKQIKKIHTLISKLNMADKDYRLMLSDYWANTCKDLQYSEAEDLIKKLEAQATTKGVWSQYSRRGKMRYEDLGKRPGMASPAQLRMIEGLWKDVSRAHNIERRQRALRKFVFRLVGVSDMSFLESHDVQKVVNAMRNMKFSHRLTQTKNDEEKKSKNQN